MAQKQGLGIVPIIATAIARRPGGGKAADNKNVDAVTKVVGNVVKVGFGLSMVIGTFYLGRMVIRDINRKKSDKEAIVPGTDAWYAMQIGDAINTDSWYSWTVDDDEEKLYLTLQEIPQGHAEKVEQAFFQRYGKTLASEFDRALSNAEKTKAIGILNQKRQ